MTEDKPEPAAAMQRVTAAMDEFMATVLRHLRPGRAVPWRSWAWTRQRRSCSTGGRISQVQERNLDQGGALSYAGNCQAPKVARAAAAARDQLSRGAAAGTTPRRPR